MARKSIKGYAEKNYYDNTRFSGGIVATNDPLNEGYFKHLVNFDISDTGQSLIPRKGFLTTIFKKGENTYTFDKDCIYFYDESLGEYIFFTFKGGEFNGVRCKFDTIKDNYFSEINVINQNLDSDTRDNSNKILGCDITGLESLTGGPYISDGGKITPLYTNQAIRVVDENNIVNYVIKVQIKQASGHIHKVFLKIYYRENKTSDEYLEDTLVLEYLDMDQVVNYVDPNYRNLASGKSIIPNPMQEVYNTNVPSGHYDRIPMLYVKDSNGKYLINEISASDIEKDGFSIIPNFYIDDTNTDTYEWLYRYEIVSTAYKTTEDVMYSSPIYHMDGTYNFDISYTLSEMYHTMNHVHWDTYGVDKTFQGIIDMYNSKNDYIEYSKKYDKLQFIPSSVPEYIMYIVPKDSDTLSGYSINLSDTSYLGPCGLSTHFSKTQIYDMHEGGTLGPTTTGAGAHNAQVKNGTLISATYTKCNNDYAWFTLNVVVYGINDIINCLKLFGFSAYIKKLDKDNIDDVKYSMLSNIQTWTEPPLKYDEILSNFPELSKAVSVAFKVLPCISKAYVYASNLDNVEDIGFKLFPGITKNNNTASTAKQYYVGYMLRDISHTLDNTTYDDVYTDNGDYEPYEEAETMGVDSLSVNEYFTRMDKNLFTYLFYYDITTHTQTSIPFGRVYSTCRVINLLQHSSLFKKTTEGLYAANLTKKSNTLYKYLLNNKYFDQGLICNFYLIKSYSSTDTVESFLRPNVVINTFPHLSISRQLIKTSNPPSTYVEVLTEDPNTISGVKNSISYTSVLGSHLVLYTGNKVYISEPGQQYYFTQFNKFEYPEPVVKVIQYKEILLVFTTQNLYAIHLEEVTKQVENGTNEDGSTKYIQEVSYEFRSHIVLYNLMVNEKYADAIQVYNQMVLFYSADGQMFLIKPTAAITSDTRFSIQYFNKSANDILLNYKDYIQRRLQDYGLDDTVGDVDIKVLANINYIKIFYSTDKITYILVYDVNNNRYFVYDTVAFSNIKYLHYIPSGELYIVSGRGDDTNLYFTIPYTDTNMVDNNVDISYYDYFSPYEINAEIDTGVINLNNHLKKRFKDLHVIYKNLNANNVAFSLETYVDDVPIITYINSTFEVRNVSSFDTLVVVDNNNVVQLIRPEDQLIDNTALFSFIDYTSNKIITHKTNIVSKGKTIRIKMKYRSKGKYKIQGFGLIYKEHTV